MPSITTVSDNTQIEVLVPGPQGAIAAGGGTLASLGSAAAAGVGARAVITDGTGSTFNAVAAGGGSTVVPVFSDGTNWRIG